MFDNSRPAEMLEMAPLGARCSLRCGRTCTVWAHHPRPRPPARHLAHRAGTTWRRLLTDPASGTVLDIGRLRYQPPQALADHVTTRYDGRCTRPGCGHQARDLDHALPWESGGTTSNQNLHPVCRGCHTAKHRGWLVTLHDDGSITWTTPHGHSATTPTPPTTAPKTGSAPPASASSRQARARAPRMTPHLSDPHPNAG